MFNLNFFKKKKGCLDGKTDQQKYDFFLSLSDFATSDKEFFRQQYYDLQPHEQKEFEKWVYDRSKNLKALKALTNVLCQLMDKVIDSNKMTKDQAIQAMQNGARVTHDYFSNREWMEIRLGNIFFEDGVSCTISDFFKDRSASGWNEGYSEVKKQVN